MNIEEFKKIPLIGILRGIKEDSIEPVVYASINAGLKAIEITMNTDNASRLISIMKKAASGSLFVGAGTVTSMQDLKSALDSGAEYIVMPTTIPEIVDYCVNKSIPVFPGALTPQEIFNAWDLGATMVKVFPAKFFGSEYFKEIKGPFDNIELLACGGVNPSNIKQYFNNGASAAAFGSSIFKKEWLDNKDYKNIEINIKNLINALK